MTGSLQRKSLLLLAVIAGTFTAFSAMAAEKELLGNTRKETGIPDINPDEWERHLTTLEAHEPFRNFIYPRT